MNAVSNPLWAHVDSAAWGTPFRVETDARDGQPSANADGGAQDVPVDHEDALAVEAHVARPLLGATKHAVSVKK